MTPIVALLERHAERPLLIDGASGRTLTYADVADRAGALAGTLHAQGVRGGDRVAVAMPNSVELGVFYVAGLLGGWVSVPLTGGLGRRGLRAALSRTRPRVVVVGERPDPALLAVASELGVVPLDLSDVSPYDGDAGTDPPAPLSVEDLASIHITSGSTGTPRAVGHRLGDFLGNAARVCQTWDLDESHRFHSTLPMTYMAGYYNLLLLPLSMGASVVIDRSFDSRSVLDFWRVPREREADVLWLVPTIIAMLLKVDRGPDGRAWVRERVRHVACGTAPLDPELRSRFEETYGVPVHDSYGLSETLLATASTPRRPAAARSVGAPLPGIDVRIESNGAVLIRSPDTMLGYLDAASPNGSLRFSPPTDADGWFNTGDLGDIGVDGQLRITGREKDIVIRGGVNVSSVEVENALRGVAGAEAVAVVGVPHDLLGEQLAAVVSLPDVAGFAGVEEQLRVRARATLEDSRQPDVYVHIDHMPVTSTGKVRKGALRDLVVDVLGLSRDAGMRVSSDIAGAGWPTGTPVDLSHPLFEGMVSFPSPNHPAPEVRVLARHEQSGRMTRRIVLGSHTGTHADAPLHFVPGGRPIDAIGLDPFVGPAQLVDLTPIDELTEVSRERLKEAFGGPPLHPRVLLRFDWSPRFVDLDFYERSPYLSLEACQWLVDHGVRLLGSDTPSPDDPRSGPDSEQDSPNHHLLLGAGVVLLEYLANLDRLAPGEVYLVALPLPVVGADGAPARVIAFAP